jgi:predicted adenylyl cyclase CyaB
VSRNVELKARDRDPGRTLQRALDAGAIEVGVLEQRDTYFAVPHGRLKLRQGSGCPAVLIPYERADAPAPTTSEYELVHVPDPGALLAALERTIGIRTVVEKTRRLLLWEETVRIHPDDVRGLGAFVEIEAIANAGSDLAREQDQVERLCSALGVEKPDRVAAGYADLLVG